MTNEYISANFVKLILKNHCVTFGIHFGHSRVREAKISEMDNGSKEIADLNENYVYNDMLARALVQLLPQAERPHITMWLEKLQSVGGDKKTLTTRNDYTWLLLLAMQSGKITEPFDKLPPTKDLPPISDIMPPHLFHEMLGSTERDLCWIDDLISDTNSPNDDNGTPSNCIPPHKFFELQPKPFSGVTCYFSVFSNEAQPK